MSSSGPTLRLGPKTFLPSGLSTLTGRGPLHPRRRPPRCYGPMGSRTSPKSARWRSLGKLRARTLHSTAQPAPGRDPLRRCRLNPGAQRFGIRFEQVGEPRLIACWTCGDSCDFVPVYGDRITKSQCDRRRDARAAGTAWCQREIPVTEAQCVELRNLH